MEVLSVIIIKLRSVVHSSLTLTLSLPRSVCYAAQALIWRRQVE